MNSCLTIFVELQKKNLILLLVKEEQIQYISSHDSVRKSLEGKIIVDESEESKIIDEDIIYQYIL